MANEPTKTTPREEAARRAKALFAEAVKAQNEGDLAADTGAVVATVSTGQRVDIEAHVARQGLTIVEFTAEF